MAAAVDLRMREELSITSARSPGTSFATACVLAIVVVRLSNHCLKRSWGRTRGQATFLFSTRRFPLLGGRLDASSTMYAWSSFSKKFLFPFFKNHFNWSSSVLSLRQRVLSSHLGNAVPHTGGTVRCGRKEYVVFREPFAVGRSRKV